MGLQHGVAAVHTARRPHEEAAMANRDKQRKEPKKPKQPKTPKI